MPAVGVVSGGGLCNGCDSGKAVWGALLRLKTMNIATMSLWGMRCKYGGNHACD